MVKWVIPIATITVLVIQLGVAADVMTSMAILMVLSLKKLIFKGWILAFIQDLLLTSLTSARELILNVLPSRLLKNNLNLARYQLVNMVCKRIIFYDV